MREPLRSDPSARTRRRAYRYRRPHTPHFYLVLGGLTGAVLVCVLNLVSYVTGSVLLATVTFGATLFTALMIFLAFFWGFYMVSSGLNPERRIVILHGAVGMLAPLFYTLNIDAALDGVGTSPVGALSLGTSFACLGLLIVQFLMGKAVVKTERLRVIRPEE
ncbi:MAG TPA: hypothetical protein VFB58_14335 [Chloroflexota bacterium]|nr:hypothetical protein [Chloroflexota bacterium]